MNLFDFVQSTSQGTKHIRVKDIQTIEDFDFLAPALLSLPPTCSQCVVLRDTGTRLADKFMSNKARKETGRAKGKMLPEEENAVEDSVKTLFSQSALVIPTESTPEKVKELLGPPITFAIRKCLKSCADEASHLSTLRLGLKGNRRLIIAPLLPVAIFSGVKIQGSNWRWQRCSNSSEG